MKKRMFSIFLLLVLVVGMTACGNSSKEFTFDGEWNAQEESWLFSSSVYLITFDEKNEIVETDAIGWGREYYEYNSDSKELLIKSNPERLYDMTVSDDESNVTLVLKRKGETVIEDNSFLSEQINLERIK